MANAPYEATYDLILELQLSNGAVILVDATWEIGYDLFGHPFDPDVDIKTVTFTDLDDTAREVVEALTEKSFDAVLRKVYLDSVSAWEDAELARAEL